jgi:hypothetical protein
LEARNSPGFYCPSALTLASRYQASSPQKAKPGHSHTIYPDKGFKTAFQDSSSPTGECCKSLLQVGLKNEAQQ